MPAKKTPAKKTVAKKPPKNPGAKNNAVSKKDKRLKGAKCTSTEEVKKTMQEMIQNAKFSKTKPGAPTKYTEELGAEICFRIAEGESLNSITRDEHIPHRSTIIHWAMFANDESHFSCPDLRERLSLFSEHYNYARIVQAENLVDECTDISDDGSNDWLTKTNASGEDFDVVNHEVVNRSKLRVETRKWLGSVYLPKVKALRDRNVDLTAKQGVTLIFDDQDKDA